MCENCHCLRIFIPFTIKYREVSACLEKKCFLHLNTHLYLDKLRVGFYMYCSRISDTLCIYVTKKIDKHYLMVNT